MHKFILFGKGDCEFVRKAEEIVEDFIFVETKKDFSEIEEPYRRIVRKKKHVTSPCIFRVKYLGGNKDLIELSQRKNQYELQKESYVIFGRDSCPYTVNSLEILERKNLDFEYFRVGSIPNEKMGPYYYEIAKRLKHNTAPCIFRIDYIGKCSDIIRYQEEAERKKEFEYEREREASLYVDSMNSS